MSYQVAFSIWLLSFEQNVAEQFDKSVHCFSFTLQLVFIYLFQKVRYNPPSHRRRSRRSEGKGHPRHRRHLPGNFSLLCEFEGPSDTLHRIFLLKHPPLISLPC